MSDNELDKAQIGSHSIDTSPVQTLNSEEDGHIPFQIEAKAVFKRLARDIYETDGAGIREPLTNAVTAVLRAVNNEYISDDDGVIDIKVKEDAGGLSLVIRDNGIGMTSNKIRKIVSVIGASEARDIGELAGQFGMGFLAVFRLVGVDGGFEMSTNPRYDDQGPITGIWKSGGFTRDSDELLTDGLDDDEYGTKFSFILKDSISRTEIRNWVEKYAKWARVPVMYEEVIDGEVDFEENYGGFNKQFNSEYPDDRPYIEFENEYVYASTCVKSEGETVLLDVPCKRGSVNVDVHTILGAIDVRLKDENGTVMVGPNKGYMVVSDGEYNNMDDSRKDKFIPRSKLQSNDISIPQPTGNRRILDNNPVFWQWITDKMNERIIEEVKSIMSRVDDYDDLMNLNKKELRLVLNCAKDNVSRTYSSSFDKTSDGRDAKKWFKQNDIDVSDKLAQKMAALTYRQKYADPDINDVTKSRNLDLRYPALAVHSARKNNGTVYMGCRLTQDKVDLVQEDDEENYVFQIEDTDNYSVYEELLDWKQLRDISLDEAREFDVDDDMLQRVFNSNNKGKTSNKTDYELKIHNSSRSSTQTYSKTVDELVEELDKIQSESDKFTLRGREIDNIILFPSHKDKNISSYYNMCNRHNLMAKCRKKDWNKLTNYDIVKSIDQVKDQANQIEFKTSIGTMTIPEFEKNHSKKYDIKFHLVPEKYKECFALDKHIKKGHKFVNEKYDYDQGTEYIYVPLTEQEIRDLHPIIGEYDVIYGDNSVRTIANTTHIMSDSIVYARIRLNEWTDTDEYNTFKQNIRSTKLDEGGYEVIETFYRGLKDQYN